jgi:hypothetical protein
MPRQKELCHAYVAGIIDGEGCLTITRHKSKTSKIGFRFCPYLDVSNTDLQLLKDLQEYFSVGSIRAKKMNASNRKQGYSWTVWGQQIRKVLVPIFPYLRLKRDRAILLLSYLDKHGRRTGSVGLSVEEHDDQSQIYNSMKQLNQRGIVGG